MITLNKYIGTSESAPLKRTDIALPCLSIQRSHCAQRRFAQAFTVGAFSRNLSRIAIYVYMLSNYYKLWPYIMG